MRQINRYIICILLIIFFIIISVVATKNIVWKKVYEKQNSHVDTIYANIVYAFINNKSSELLRVSEVITTDGIIYIGKNKNLVRYYEYLCPMLNEKFKNILIENYSNYHRTPEDKKYFLKGYKKLTEHCSASKK